MNEIQKYNYKILLYFFPYIIPLLQHNNDNHGNDNIHINIKNKLGTYFIQKGNLKTPINLK